MDSEFKEYFLKFAKANRVYLATGSDYPKTVEQIGSKICETVKACYNCSGNSIWVAGKEVYSADWELPELARYFLESCLYESKFSIRTGTHIELTFIQTAFKKKEANTFYLIKNLMNVTQSQIHLIQCFLT